MNDQLHGGLDGQPIPEPKRKQKVPLKGGKDTRKPDTYAEYKDLLKGSIVNGIKYTHDEVTLVKRAEELFRVLKNAIIDKAPKALDEFPDVVLTRKMLRCIEFNPQEGLNTIKYIFEGGYSYVYEEVCKALDPSARADKHLEGMGDGRDF